MFSVTSTEFRQMQASVMDEASHDKTPVLITRQGAENMVMLPESEWSAIQETLHLFGNPVNAQHLLESMAQADRGEVVEMDLTTGTFK